MLAARAGTQSDDHVYATDAANEIVAESLVSYEEDLWRAAALDLRDVARTVPLPRLDPAPGRPAADPFVKRSLSRDRDPKAGLLTPAANRGMARMLSHDAPVGKGGFRSCTRKGARWTSTPSRPIGWGPFA